MLGATRSTWNWALRRVGAAAADSRARATKGRGRIPDLRARPPRGYGRAPLPVPYRMLPTDLIYVALLFVLFVVPRFLQRYRLPSAVTSLLLGLAAGWLGLLAHDGTVELLSTFGIVALFLFAGLDVDLEDLRPDLRPLLQYLALWIAMLGGVAWVVAA